MGVTDKSFKTILTKILWKTLDFMGATELNFKIMNF